jgi:hypothetical protein
MQQEGLKAEDQLGSYDIEARQQAHDVISTAGSQCKPWQKGLLRQQKVAQAFAQHQL